MCYSLVQIALFTFDKAHFNRQILDEHLDRIFILGRKGNNNVSKAHSGLDKIIIGRLHEPIVLLENVNNGATSFFDVPIDTSRKSDIIGGQHKNLDVHEVAKSFLQIGVDAFEENNGRRLHKLGNFGALVQRKVIRRNVHIFSANQTLQLFIRKVKIKGIRMIKVVICSIFVLIIRESFIETIKRQLSNFVLEGLTYASTKTRLP